MHPAPMHSVHRSGSQAQVKAAVISAQASSVEAQELQLKIAFALVGLTALISFWAA